VDAPLGKQPAAIPPGQNAIEVGQYHPDGVPGSGHTT